VATRTLLVYGVPPDILHTALWSNTPLRPGYKTVRSDDVLPLVKEGFIGWRDIQQRAPRSAHRALEKRVSFADDLRMVDLPISRLLAKVRDLLPLGRE
jgi:hypothetical protein